MSLYKTLYEILEEEEELSDFSTQEVQEITDDICANVGKKIGASEYQKLEQFITQNKDDAVLKEIVGNISLPLALKMLASNLDDVRIEKVIGYKVTTQLYECLSKNNYDLNQALLDSI